MADAALASQAAASLLDAIDTAFEQALGGRYGGGIQVCLSGSPPSEPQTLRPCPAGVDDCIQLHLQPAGGPAASMAHGVVVGAAALAAPGKGVQDISIAAEIHDTHDMNEAADATFLTAGLLIAPGAGGTLVVARSSQGQASTGQQAQRQQRGFLPQQHRNRPGRALGLSSSGHRRALPSSVSLPITAELLTRLAGAVAGLHGAGGVPVVGSMTLLVQSGGPGG